MLNVIVDYAFKRILIERYSAHAAKDRFFKEINKIPRFLIVGDSHILFSVNPDYFHNSFNYAGGNENYIQTYYKLKDIVEKQKKIPEFILLPIDPSSFCAFRSERFINDAYWIRYVNFIEVSREKRNYHYLYRYFMARFASYAGNYAYLYNFINPLSSYFNSEHSGFVPRHDNFKLDRNKEKSARHQALLYLGDHKYFDHDMEVYFCRMMDLCKNHGIGVFLVRIPLSEAYFRNIKKLVPVNDLYQKVDSLTKSYPNVHEIWKFQKAYFGHPDYFSNPDHMNVKGAKRFSIALYKEILSITDPTKQ